MKQWHWIHLLALGSIIAFCCVTALPGGQQGGPLPATKQDARTLFNRLLAIAYSSGNPVRLYYLGACPSKASDVVPFPSVRTQDVSEDKTGLAAFREFFDNDRSVKVTQDSTRLIRIWIGKVPTKILETKLPRLNLDPTAQYNPDGVFEAIMNTREMNAAEHSLGFTHGGVTLGYTGVVPDERLPHLPRTLKNMSAEQVLDRVAETWAGRSIIIYGACAKAEKSDQRRPYVLNWQGQAALPTDFGLDR